MSDVNKDSAIKLFGKTISLPQIHEVSAINERSASTLAFGQGCSDHQNLLRSSSITNSNSANGKEHDYRNKVLVKWTSTLFRFLQTTVRSTHFPKKHNTFIG